MKILLIDQFAKATGRDTITLAKEIDQSEQMDVHVYVSDNIDWVENDPYLPKITKGFKGAYEGSYLHKALCYLRALFVLAAHINKNHYDIVHLQWFSLPWIEWIFVLWLKLTKHKVVITVHDIVPFDNFPLEMKFLDLIYSEADMLLLHTELACSSFHNLYKAKTPVQIITQAFCKKSDYCILNKDEAKAHFGIPKGMTVFLFFGTIRPSKGLNVLISAFSRASEVSKTIFLLAAGQPHNINLNQYEELIKDKLNENNALVKFGLVPQSEEQWYFSAADVLCIPYLELTQSGVAQLGLMYELPIIATDVGGMPEVVRDESNGLLIPSENEDRLMEAILWMERNPEMRNQFSIQAKKLAETEFSLTRKVEKIINAYNQIASK